MRVEMLLTRLTSFWNNLTSFQVTNWAIKTKYNGSVISDYTLVVVSSYCKKHHPVGSCQEETMEKVIQCKRN